MEETNAFDLADDTKLEIIDKIEALAWQIRNNWTDPKSECREIVELTIKLKTIDG